MNYIKLQRFYVQALIKSNQANDISSIKSIFKNKFNIPFLISNNEFSQIKNKVHCTLQKLELIEICKKNNNENITINIKTIDISYDLNKNYKKEKKKKK